MIEGCPEHSGCLADIAHLKSENTSQWEAVRKVSDKVDNIMTRLNIILGGIVVACILLVINIVVKTV